MNVGGTSIGFLGATAFAALLASGGGLQVFARQAPTDVDLRIEGDYVRVDVEGSGSFDGLGDQFPKAELLPGVQPMGRGGRGGPGGGAPAPGGAGRGNYRTGAAGPLKPGEVVVVNPRPCGGRGGTNVGAGLINPDSGGIHIVEAKSEVVILGERGGWRHIWLDGRKHPDPLTASGAGHSIGHYEGNVLLVDTVGFTPGPVPGGGARTPDTHLTERYEVQPDGKSLKVTYTWNDPKIYAKPHTYRLIFDRVPTTGGFSYAMEEWCDASNPAEGQSITAPAQQ